ncbi:hypothetical protein [Klebsiella phage vB_KvaP_F5M1D]|nr:hypothetical protein [Klebsiella phage vB_KvaP_F5M1D]
MYEEGLKGPYSTYPSLFHLAESLHLIIWLLREIILHQLTPGYLLCVATSFPVIAVCINRNILSTTI